MLSAPAVTRHRGSAEQLNALYDSAASLAKMGVWECDLLTEELVWTGGVYDLFGLPRGQTVRRDAIVDLYHEESRQQMQELRAEAIRTGGRFSLDARIRTLSGDDRWMRLTAAVETRDGQPVRLFGAKQDITHERDLLDRLSDLANRDPVTGLVNRRVFETRLHALAQAASDGMPLAALAIVDLDRFKPVNDRFGHLAGDECLREVGVRLSRVFRTAVLVSRIGGDEFAILFAGRLNGPQIADMLVCGLSALRLPIFWRNQRLDIGASIGVTLFDRRLRNDPGRIFAEADTALYDAKADGRGTIRFFQEEWVSRIRPSDDEPPGPRSLGYG